MARTRLSAVSFRVTAEELDAYSMLVDEEGESLSVVVRGLLRQRVAAVLTPAVRRRRKEAGKDGGRTDTYDPLMMGAEVVPLKSKKATRL